MAIVSFYVRSDNNPAKIYARLSMSRKNDVRRSTGLSINPEYWSNKKRGSIRPKAEFAGKDHLVEALDNLRQHIESQSKKAYTTGQDITPQWLDETIGRFFGRLQEYDLTRLYDYTLHYADLLPYKVQRKGKRGVSHRTISKYRTIALKIRQFEKHRGGKRLLVRDVNMKFHADFIAFLLGEQKLNDKTTGKYITFVKTVCRHAERNGIPTHPDLKNPDFRPIDSKTLFVTLNDAEIEQIRAHNFRTAPYLENARDWLIIGLFVGARAGDLLNLTMDNVRDVYIEYTAKKTGQIIMAPLHHYTEEILERLGGFPRKISTQRFNDYIKIVCREAGITDMVEGAMYNPDTKRKEPGTFPKWQLVTTHICRRSFATNHYYELDTAILMAITGHKTERQFLEYIDKTARNPADALKKLWESKRRQAQAKVVRIGKAN